MAAPSPKISVAVEPPAAYLKIAGRAAVESSRDFKALVLKLSATGIRYFILDLRECLLMDSTFSGVLAGLVALPSAQPGTPTLCCFTLVQPNERVADLLDNLGVMPLVQRIQEGDVQTPSVSFEELPPGQHTKAEIATNCLEAHRILMALKPENVAKFRSLEQTLAAQLTLL